jgi:hypothetical protein
MLADPKQASLLKRALASQANKSWGKALLYQQEVHGLCNAIGITQAIPEHQFCPNRKWRFDWAWPAKKIALEIDGGILRGGRHTTSISGRLRDIEKLNTAASMGWLVLTATTIEKPITAKRGGKLPWLSLSDLVLRQMLLAAFYERKTS